MEPLLSRLGLGDDRVLPWLLAAAATLVFGTAAVLTVLLARERTETIDLAITRAEALTLVLESDAARALQAVDATLAGVADMLRLSDLAPNDPLFQSALTERAAALRPYVRAIYVIGADGWIIHDTDYPTTPNVTLADRDYFRAFRDDSALQHAISEPLQSRSGLGWFFAVSRRIERAGEFLGIAVAAVQPQYFESLYARLGLAEAEAIALYHSGGTLVAQFPIGSADIGRSFADCPLFAEKLPSGPAGSEVTADGRLVSYRTVESFPLVVALQQDMDVVLAHWRHTAIGAAAATVGLLLVLGVLVDQVRRHQRARELMLEQQAQNEKLEALGHLTSGVAHDFKNLLSVVSSSLALIAVDSSEAARNEAVKAAERAVDRGADLVQALSGFARRRPIEIVPADLSRCVERCAQLLRHAAGKGVEVAIELGEHLPPCMLAAAELELALVNLVVNAKDALNGSGRIVVKTYLWGSGADAARAESKVCVAVQDDGPGMTDDVQRRAFEPYFTTKGERGNGFGLAQVYGFMQQVGGEARIESRLGSGTRVVLMFKAAPEPHGSAR